MSKSITSTTKKVPNLRFREFNDEWEEKKLGETVKINPKTGNIPDSFIYIDLESVTNGRLLKEEKIEVCNAPSRAQRILIKEDILYQTVRPYQKNNLYFDKNGEYVASTGYAQLRMTCNSQKFIFQYLHFQKFVDKVIENCTGTSYPAINSTDLSKIQINIPSLPEQQKIASFLSSVDEKITKLTEKKKLLETYKKGVMQKIFSREIRFKNENGKEFSEWEEKKIGDIFDKVTRGNVLAMTKVLPKQQDDYQYPVYSSQTKNHGLSGFYTQFLFENAITWTTDGANAGDVNYRKDKFYCTNVCGVLLSDKGYANQCIAEILNSVTRNYVSYVGNPKLMNNIMANISIYIPSSVKEQEKIASFLTEIDTKIEIIGNELAEAEKWKKGLLQEMFI